MASRSLSFLLFGEDVSAGKAFKKVAADAEASTGKIKGAFSKSTLIGAGGIVAGLVIATKEAANFQTSMVRLVTAAGESESNLKMVSKGVLDLSAATGTSTDQMAKGMYIVESAGYHGAQGLDVLKASAQGAKIEGADLGEVANAVSSLLVDYHLPAERAATVTSQLVAAVGHGKTTFQQLATALPNVAAAAASLNVTLPETTAAIATMTMHGTDAAKAATYLRQMLGQLGGGGSAIARSVMKGLGIDANQLALTLTSGSGHGLSDAIKMLEEGIQNHLTPAGLVAVEMFKKSTGSVSDYQKMLANLPPDMTTTFGALSKMTGGVKSMQGFLQLGGENLKTFEANTKAVASATADASGNVEGWARKQQTLNQKLDELKQSANQVVIEVGTALIPSMTSAAGFALKHKDALMVLVGGLVAVKAMTVAVTFAQEAWAATTALVTGAISVMETVYVAAMIAMDSAMGPIGIALLGIGALVAVGTKGFGAFGGSAHDAVKPVESLTSAITEDGLAVGKLTTAQINQKLSSDGAYQAGLKLGISQQTVLQAALGNAAAHDRVTAAVDGATGAYKKAGGELHSIILPINHTTAAQRDAKKAADTLGKSVGGTSDQLKASKTAAMDQAAAMKKNASATKDTAGAAKLATGTFQTETDAVQSLSDSLKGLNTRTLDVKEAQLSMLDAERSLTDGVHQNGRSLNENSDAGRKNVQSLLAGIKAAQAHALAVESSGHSATFAARAYMADEAALRKAATSAGLNKTEVDKLIRSYGGVPDDVRTKIQTEDADAKASIASYKKAIANLPKSIQQTVEVHGIATAEYELQLLSRSRTATLTVQTQVLGGGAAGVRSVGGKQVFASGTDYAYGGSTLVGEQGPELVNLPRGSQVLTASRTRAGNGGNSITINVHVTQPLGTPDQIARVVGPALTTAVRNGMQKPF